MSKAQIIASRKIAWLYWKDYCFGFSDGRILIHFELTLNGLAKIRALKFARISSVLRQTVLLLTKPKDIFQSPIFLLANTEQENVGQENMNQMFARAARRLDVLREKPYIARHRI